MTNKDKYRLLCKNELSIPIFSKDWWLDSVAGDAWDVVLVEKGDQILASMPYTMRQRYGLNVISQPALTQTLGPWLRRSTAKYARRLSQEKDLLQKLFEQLPDFAHFQQNWHCTRTNWLPLYWLGYEQTTRYTYVVENVSNLENAWQEIDSSYRNKIRKAEKLVTVKVDMDIKEFYLINEMTFLRQGINIPYSQSFLEKHHKVLQDNNASKIFYAVDEQENIHSALYLTWDSTTSYVHLVGENPELRNSGAGILLIWEAIKYTAEQLNLDYFDFEGSMIESVERVRRDFGAVQTPYFSISKTNSKLIKTYRFLQEIRK